MLSSNYDTASTHLKIAAARLFNSVTASLGNRPFLQERVTLGFRQLLDRPHCAVMKSLPKAFPHRLQRHLPKVVHQYKNSGCGRLMHNHILHIEDIQGLVTNPGEEAYATFLDFVIAYDRV
uniref:AlNc14C2G310 protein n=1 Tax=Albugo laibachii Nc14 TaxID=890382 RepID=F0VZH2_9STRA|nr:AlNc14C2G310 [Albugo laibachii Nc14]|eukprot:CCA14202.1 AlNc14C2G310 [Albugo laibachii Nc14]